MSDEPNRVPFKRCESLVGMKKSEYDALVAERDELREWMASAVPEIRCLYRQLRYAQRQDPNEFIGTVKEVLDRAAAIINSPEGREETQC